MEGMEVRLVELWRTEMKVIQEEINSHMMAIDQRLDQQGARMDEMQLKVTMLMESIGKMQQEQVMVAKLLKASAPPCLMIPPREDMGILGMRSGDCVIPRTEPSANPPASNPPCVQFPPTPVVDEIQETSRGNWMPKMEFPRFDGTDVRIWVDKCQTFFTMYKIPEGFKVSAATMYMSNRAAHWYQAFMVSNGWHNWEQFKEAVVTEFEGNIQRDKMRELLILKQTSSVEEYRRKFDEIVYQLRLYDHNIGGLMLVTRFVLGLKEDLRAAVELQMPTSVAMAATLAGVQEGVLERTKKGVHMSRSAGYYASSGKTEEGHKKSDTI